MGALQVCIRAFNMIYGKLSPGKLPHGRLQPYPKSNLNPNPNSGVNFLEGNSPGEGEQF